MRIVLRSQVKAPFQEVADNFGEDLFTFLLPPKFIARLVAYEGSKPGSKVHIRFRFPIPSDWISIIKSEERTQNKYIFVDEGEKLPFGLRGWKHIHSITKTDHGATQITDDMNFTTGSGLLDLLVYPVLYLSFYPRKKLYKKYFEK